MKKAALSVLLVIAIALLAGCSSSNSSTVAIGTYAEKGEASVLRITIEDEQRFTFTHLALSSWPPKGDYQVTNEQLILVVDSENRYAFDMKGDSLVYNAAASTVTQEAYPAFDHLEDGTIFELDKE